MSLTHFGDLSRFLLAGLLKVISDQLKIFARFG